MMVAMLLDILLLLYNKTNTGLYKNQDGSYPSIPDRYFDSR